MHPSDDFKRRMLQPVDSLFRDIKSGYVPPSNQGRNYQPPPSPDDPTSDQNQFEVLESKKSINKGEFNLAAYEDAFEELNRLIGLQPVNQSIQRLADYVKIETMRRKMKLPLTQMSFHCVFSGNPGTGKTTVARLLGKIFRALGMLSSGHVHEVSKANLVGGYLGQTPGIVEAAFDAADGGVLFIDEAYSLTEDSADMYGKEAIDMLVKLMEDRRDNVVVIVAGYPEKMKLFIDSNPGLRSRFSRNIFFPDYNSNDLQNILNLMCDTAKLQVSPGFLFRSEIIWDELTERGITKDGNGRIVRNAFELILENQAARLCHTKNPKREDMLSLQPEDWDGVQRKIQTNLS